MLDIKVEGYREAVGIFRQLSEQMQKKLLRQALRKSSRPIVQGAKSRAPKRIGLLRKSIRMISLRKDHVPLVTVLQPTDDLLEEAARLVFRKLE